MDGDSEGRFVIPGTETGSEAVVNIEKVPKIPDSQDSMREVMIKEIIDKGLWEEIATLNSISVNPKLKKKQYSNELMEVLNMYIYEDEETSRITLRKSNEKNKILLFILFVIFHLDVFSHTQNIILEKEMGNTATMGIPVMQKC